MVMQAGKENAWLGVLKGSAGNFLAWLGDNGHQEICGVAWVQLGEQLGNLGWQEIQVDGNDGWSPIQVGFV